MKKFANEADLKRYALAKGATVPGFNTSREKVEIADKKPVEPALAAPAAPPVPVVVENDLTVKAMVQQTATLSQLFDELRAEIRAAATLSAMPPDEWVFEVERDSKGFAKKIKARAVRPRMN